MEEEEWDRIVGKVREIVGECVFIVAEGRGFRKLINRINTWLLDLVEGGYWLF